ncbi:MAG: hypothetical protein R3242_06015 [Akkermansiaceae bacterium]|nr:hypothetical protein [Akkermansiaceae bacterium]
MKLQIYTTVFLIATLGGIAFAQTKADPYKPTNNNSTTQVAKPSQPAVIDHDDAPKNISTCLEVFSMPIEVAAAMQRENLSDADCYKRIVNQLGNESVQQEMLIVLRSRSGERSTSEAIVEEIYPTEYESTVLPTTLSLGADSGNESGADTNQGASPIHAPCMPIAFDTRNTGEILDIEPTLSPDAKYCNMRMMPEQVLLTAFNTYGEGVSETRMPTFETRRVNSAFTVAIGKPFLIGTMSRASGSKIDSDTSNKVSFAFITINLSH